jgi:hypothetical protein
MSIPKLRVSHSAVRHADLEAAGYQDHFLGRRGRESTALGVAEALHAQPVRCFEFGSFDVPPGADTAWGHRVLEGSVRRAVQHQREGSHLLLCGRCPSESCWLRLRPTHSMASPRACCIAHRRFAASGCCDVVRIQARCTTTSLLESGCSVTPSIPRITLE